MNRSFENKVVLVTGAGRGIGKAVAQAFAAEGAKVMIAARTLDYGQAVKDEILASGGEADLVQVDNCDRAAMKAMVEKTAQRFGGIDIVVHSAAHWVQHEVVDMDDDDFNDMVTSNIHSMFWLAKDTEPYLSQAKDRGRLIYISSGSANRQYVPGLTCYTATKAYMNYFARGLAMELGKRNILVNVIEPGLIASDRVKSNIDDTILNALTSTYPVPRAGLPAEIAASILFLASSQAGYITGASLLVDGGSSMSPMPDLEKVLAEAER